MIRPLVIGHRGAPGYRPEHTRGSYELAIRMGVGAVEPDVVVSRDGVLVIRHENELSTTTDVAERPEFTDRRTTKRIDGLDHVGWFAEDFDWDELATLRCRERIPGLRPVSAAYDDQEPMLRLRDLLLLLDEHRASGRDVAPVIEIKHATFFAENGWEMAALLEAELTAAGWGGGDRGVVIESFELTVLRSLGARGVRADLVFLVEAAGSPFDQVAALGGSARSYAQWLTDAGLGELSRDVSGISLDKALLLPAGDADTSLGGDLVAAVHGHGLRVFTWTCRPENAFLSPPFRRGSDLTAFGGWQAEWARLRDAGIDGVFVDHPDLGVGFF